MIDFLIFLCTVTGAGVWVALFVLLIAYATGIADFGLNIEVEKTDVGPK